MTNNCEDGRITLSQDNQGRSWEHFWTGNRYHFSNQIPNLQSYTTTTPGWPLADRGYCEWAGTPPPKIPATVDGATPPADETVPNSPQPVVAATPDAGMASEGAGGLMILALLGAGICQWAAKRRGASSGYDPHADLDLTLPPLGNFAAKQTHGIRGVEGDGFAFVSPGFASNSHVHQTERENGPNLGNPGVAAVSQSEKEWPEIPLQFDPLQPEQGDEFEMFRYLVEKDGLAAKGVDIIKQMWGCSPGRSRAYAEARKRRDEFAKRLEYYRYDGR